MGNVWVKKTLITFYLNIFSFVFGFNWTINWNTLERKAWKGKWNRVIPNSSTLTSRKLVKCGNLDEKKESLGEKKKKKWRKSSRIGFEDYLHLVLAWRFSDSFRAVLILNRDEKAHKTKNNPSTGVECNRVSILCDIVRCCGLEKILNDLLPTCGHLPKLNSWQWHDTSQKSMMMIKIIDFASPDTGWLQKGGGGRDVGELERERVWPWSLSFCFFSRLLWMNR